MSITIREINRLKSVEKVIIHSHDVSLYLVSIIHEGEEKYVVGEDGVPLKAHNKLKLQALFARVPVGKMVLRQESPYDEMIGLPQRETDNRLEVDIGNTQIGLVDDKKQ